MTNAGTPTEHGELRGPGRPHPFDPLPWIEYGATTMALAVLVQAALAGQIVSGDHSFVAPHRVLAESLPLLGLGLALLPWVHRRPSRLDLVALGLAVSAGLVVAQTGLGFVGRESTMAIAIHVPVGVAILGIYVACAVAARMRRGLRL